MDVSKLEEWDQLATSITVPWPTQALGWSTNAVATHHDDTRWHDIDRDGRLQRTGIGMQPTDGPKKAVARGADVAT